MIDAIAREAGLYPYIVGRSANWRDELAIETMRAPGLPDIVFHIEQAVVFHKLAEGRSVILSAPTSFGKSLLIDALVAYRAPTTVVAVVPTIALLDEFRRRMEQRFPDYQVITRSAEQRSTKQAIFIGTQERLLEREDLDRIDLFIIDEFYKLDLDRNDKRSLALNTILARYGKRAKQIYFLGPSIDDVPNAANFRPGVEFIKTRYSPVTADIIDRTDVGPSPEKLVEDLVSVGRASSLIYVQSPPAAARLADHLIKSKLIRHSEFCVSLSEWLRENFHPEWILAGAVAKGIGIHHGRIPRSIAHLMISLFNQTDIAAIICTSSMIEGINTAAENVFIYDRNISTSKLDRFTFDNIKGRAGRMFKHNIGKVFLYNVPPDQTQFDVRVPLFNADELMAPELLLQLQDDALTPVARRRKRAISEASALPTRVLSTWAEFGIDGLNALADRIRDEADDSNSLLFWKGLPTFDQIEATFNAPWNILEFQKHDIRSPRQLAMFANRLRTSGSIRSYFDGLVSKKGLEAQPEIDRCFNFMRGAEYTFPQVLRALNDVVDAVLGEDIANYRVYASQLQNLFLPGELRALDEFGVPLPLVQRLSRHLPVDDVGASRKALEVPSNPVRNSLSPFELQLLARGIA
ncbi:DEAD/DEAH box helicase [Bradyrhizobium sp. AZCC 1578]|uniref:DEAD/DEAH box helicase n=1 Tax=Bradyrhizobium sp. AZCC 1578 TaxID=3117027 RepID=UPI002FEF400E